MLSIEQKHRQDIYSGASLCQKDIYFVHIDKKTFILREKYQFYNNENSQYVKIADVIESFKPQIEELIGATYFIFNQSHFHLLGADPLTRTEIDKSKFLKMESLIIAYRPKVQRKSKATENKILQNHKIFNALSELHKSLDRLEESTQLQVPMNIPMNHHHQEQESDETHDFSQRNIFLQNFNDQNIEMPSLMVYGEGYEFQQRDDQIHQNSHLSIDNQQIQIEKRVKERSISYVVKKVQDWRKYYEQGIEQPEVGLQKLTLDESAHKVRLSRKTLDDYYAQIRRGQQLGFDFQANKNAKMGVLRKFVRNSLKVDSSRHKTNNNQDIHTIYQDEQIAETDLPQQVQNPEVESDQEMLPLQNLQLQHQPSSIKYQNFDFNFEFNNQPQDGMEIEYAPPNFDIADMYLNNSQQSQQYFKHFDD